MESPNTNEQQRSLVEFDVLARLQQMQEALALLQQQVGETKAGGEITEAEAETKTEAKAKTKAKAETKAEDDAEDEAKTKAKTDEPSDQPPSDVSDLIWGAEAIGAEINHSANQVYYLFESGALDGAATKAGHRTIVASRTRLRGLFVPNSK
jgi:hypothetical protein